MKKALLFLIIPTLLSWNNDWVIKIEKVIKEVNAKSFLVFQNQKKVSGINVKTKLYKTNSETKIVVNYSYKNPLFLTQEYFKNERYIFSKIEYGIIPITGKKDTLILFEKRTYFKHKNLGFQAYRELKVNINDDHEGSKVILSRKEFKSKDLKSFGLKDYLKIEKKFNKLKKEVTKQ